MIETRILQMLNVSIDDLLGHRRFKPFVSARHLIWYLLYNTTEITFQELGARYNRDHTTIIHGVYKIQDHIDSYPDFKLEVERLI